MGKRLEVAMWSPVLGFAVKDDLFPHVSGGLRGRRVTITSIEVIFSDDIARQSTESGFRLFPRFRHKFFGSSAGQYAKLHL